jgi:hypothetical protein
MIAHGYLAGTEGRFALLASLERIRSPLRIAGSHPNAVLEQRTKILAAQNHFQFMLFHDSQRFSIAP